jgi:hypothetical protein
LLSRSGARDAGSIRTTGPLTSLGDRGAVVRPMVTDTGLVRSFLFRVIILTVAGAAKRRKRRESS